LVLITVSCCVEFGSYKTNKTSEYWYEKGLELVEQERYSEALKAFNKAIKINSESTVLWNNKGLALCDLNRQKEALVAFEKALEINSSYRDAWYNKGRTLTELKRHDEALLMYNKVLEIDSCYSDALVNKGLTLNELGRYEEALEIFDSLLEVNSSNPSIWHNKGVVLQSDHRYNESIYYYNRALEIKPDFMRAWNNRAFAFKELYQNKTKWTRYVNNEYSYSFECPVDWYMHLLKLEHSEFSIIFAEFENHSLKDMSLDFTEVKILSTVELFEEPIDFEIDEIYEYSIEHILTLDGEIKKRKTEINNKETWIFEYTSTDKNLKQKDAVFVCSPNKIIAVGISAKPDDFSRYEPIFNRVINSVEC